MNNKGIYFAGNFLSNTFGTTAISEVLAEEFSNRDWLIVKASTYAGRLRRMVDFLITAWRKRNIYILASVEVYSEFAFIWAEFLCWLLRILNKPYILNLHGGKLPEFMHDSKKRVLRLIQSAVAVTTPSKYILESFYPIRNDISYIPNGITVSAYTHNFRPSVQPKLVWLRAFHEIYAPSLAVQVLENIIDDFPPASLTMIGPDKKDGSYQQALALIHKHELEDRVTLTGAIPKADVGRYLSRGDIFLNTTNYESFGVSTLEAAACGLCIVTTNVGELSYMWEDGNDALLVPPNDPEAMAAAVRRILTEPGLAAHLSAKARKKAENYDWSVIIPQWEALFDKILQS